MKKILLMLMLFLGFGSITIMGQTSVRVYPTATFVGVTKKGTTYAKQSIEKDPKRFFVGYDATTSTYGRGYLEFDLSPLPKDATIVSVSLQLTSVIAYDNNFNGKIKLYSCGNYMDANEVIWNSLKGIANLDLISTDMQREGYGKALSNEALNITTKNAIGKKLYLAINHVDESKVIRFTGDIKDLYLDIEYKDKEPQIPIIPTPKPPTQEEPSDPKPDLPRAYPAPAYAIPNNQFTLGVEHDTGYILGGYSLDGCQYDSELFTEVKRDGCSIVLVPKKIRGMKMATVTMVIKYKFMLLTLHKYKFTWVFPVYGDPYITAEKSVVREGDLVTYYIEDLLGPNTSVYTEWQGVSNMTFVPGQSISYGTFRASKNGEGKVKAIITGDKVSYTVENSDVWVGVPQYNYFADNNVLTQYRDMTSTFMLNAPFKGYPTSYEWKVNGQPLSYRYITDDDGGISILFKYLPVGVYDYSVTARNSCGASQTKYFSVTITNDPNDAP